MAPNKKFITSSVALTTADRIALSKLADALSLPRGVVARDAISWYANNYDVVSKNQKKDKENEKDERVTTAIVNATNRIIAVITKSTNRICSLQVRSIIDSNITMMLFYRMLPEEKADQIMAKMYRMAITRVTRKLPKEELSITRMISEGLEQEILDEKLPKAS
jgi:hypothetical protein